MQIEQVKKLSPEERFWYWVRERHQIGKRKRSGLPKPWTDDEILQQYFFTHPYREHDKVSVWFREKIRDPLKDDPRVLLATVIFRWFNLPSTGEILLKNAPYEFGSLERWNRTKVVDRLSKEREKKRSVFTGAFMINSPPGKPKLEAIADRIDNVWKDRKALLSFAEKNAEGPECSMEDLHLRLMAYDGLGGFMAYEIVCDLRYTYLLRNAVDKMTWANPGPGCIRGVYRITSREIKNKSNATSPPKPPDLEDVMEDLLARSRNMCRKMPPFEMREIEHSLCEFDKYERLLWSEGRSKRTYKGT